MLAQRTVRLCQETDAVTANFWAALAPSKMFLYALQTPEVIIPHQAPGTPNTITHGLHPLHDRSRSRIASGLLV
jgi:hypothetical protein